MTAEKLTKLLLHMTIINKTKGEAIALFKRDK